VTHDNKTDTEDLIERLEDSKGWPNLGKAAAARIRELEAEKKKLALDVLAAQGQAADLEAENSLEAVRQKEREKALREAMPVASALAAAISLLDRARLQAPSDKMFEQMLLDYQRALDDFRARITEDQTND